MVCGKSSKEVGPISWRGKCNECGKQRACDALEDMATHSGPFFDRWRSQLAASVGATIPSGGLDDVREAP